MEEKRIIYGDYAATSPVAEEVRTEMEPWLFNCFGNPSSLHELGQEAGEAIEKARRDTAHLIGASPDEVFFTSGGTESNNWVIKGTAMRCLKENDRRRLLVSSVEHPSVLRTCESLIPLGFRVELIPVDENGVVSTDALRCMMDKDCALCAVMHANNETGIVEPVAECAEISHAEGALFLTDAVQTVGHIPVDVKNIRCDFLSLSGHKFGAPKGIGALYIRKGIILPPLIHGGGQERGLRSGTENTAGIVGIGAACRLAEKELSVGEAERIATLRDRIEKRLVALGGVVNGVGKRVPGTLNISFPDIGGESLMLLCDIYGVCISTGSACSLGHGDGISHVLRAMKLSEKRANGSVRISIGREIAMSDADELADAMEKCILAICAQGREVK